MSQFSNNQLCDTRIPHFSWFPIIFTDLPNINGLPNENINYVSYFHISHIQSPEKVRQMSDQIPVYAPCHVLKIPKNKKSENIEILTYSIQTDTKNNKDTNDDKKLENQVSKCINIKINIGTYPYINTDPESKSQLNLKKLKATDKENIKIKTKIVHNSSYQIDNQFINIDDFKINEITDKYISIS